MSNEELLVADLDLLSIQSRSQTSTGVPGKVPDPAPERAGEEPLPPSSSIVPDPAGVTGAERLAYLQATYDQALKDATSGAKSRPSVAQKMLLYRCIGTILHASGRAAYASQLTEEEKKSYHLRAEDRERGRHVLSQDGALFEFHRGEFPDFDRAFDLLQDTQTRPEDRELAMLTEKLFERALSTLLD